MDRQEVQNTIKSVIVRIVTVLIIILVLLTYFSSTIDNVLLPHVTVVYPMESSVGFSLNTSSKLEPANKLSFSLSRTIKIESVLAVKDQSLKKGDKILKFDSSSYSQVRDSLYLDVLRIRNQIDVANQTLQKATEDEARYPIVAQLNELEVQQNLAQLSYNDFVECIDEDGYLLAKENIIITNVLANSSYQVNAGETIYEYTKEQTSFIFSFYASGDVNEFISEGDNIDVYIPIKSEDGETKQKQVLATIVTKNESETELNYTYSARLDNINLDKGQFMPQFGDSVNINMDFSDERFEHVLMKTCIQEDLYGHYVYILKENNSEFYVKKEYISIIKQNQYYAAVEINADNVTKVILTSTKHLSEGQKVILDE